MKNSRKRFFAPVVASAVALFCTSGYLFAAEVIKDPTKLQIQQKLQINQAVIHKQCEGPDPAVMNININKTATPGMGILNITAIVKNNGTQNFVSNPNQAAVLIQAHNKKVSGPTAYETIKNQNFGTLNKGVSMSVVGTYQIPLFIEWGHRTAVSGECQCERDIITMLNYDPDIYMDANKQNDDCNQNNNKKTVNVKYMCQCPW